MSLVYGAPAHMSVGILCRVVKKERGTQSTDIHSGTSIVHRPESGKCDALHLETAALRPNMDSC